LESLVMHVQNAVIGYQRFLTKSEKSVVLNLCNEHEQLKLNYDNNKERIAHVENQLCLISDSAMKESVAKSRHFEIINSEKITPLFLKLAKGANTNYSLSDICDDTGCEFKSDTDRNNYITGKFSETYALPRCDVDCKKNLIEDFLGPDIINHPIVSDSKLTDQEKLELDRPLSIAELDTALQQANIRSAPGLDGLNMNFIVKFWHIFRDPLLNYANTCFEKGTLTPTFRSAGVRLIPKKGCKKSIKNWRPISLLSNLYKIISRALNNRLKKVVD
jgi:hypothetical protein